MSTSTKTILASREYEFSNESIEPLNIFEDPSGLLRGGVGSTIWDAGLVFSKYFEISAPYWLPTDSLARSKADLTKPIRVLELGSGTGIVGLVVAQLLSQHHQSVFAQVVLTDKENVVPLLQRNVVHNHHQFSKNVTVSAQVLDWEVVSGVQAATVGVIDDENKEGKGEQEVTREKEDNHNDNMNHADQTVVGPTNVPSSPQESSMDPLSQQEQQLSVLDQSWDLVIVSDCIWVRGLYEPLVKTLEKLIPEGSKARLYIGYEKRDFSMEMNFFEQLGQKFRFRDIKATEMDPHWQSEDIFIFVCERR